jgi:hypothetical protein
MNFEDFWNAWPRSTRKGGKSTCKAKWDKLGLDIQADQIIKHVEWMKTTDAWKKAEGAYIPAPLVYINQQRWDGAEIPEMTVNVNINFKDPALEKIETDTARAAKMPQDVAEKLRELRKHFTQHTQIVH